jgi:hypothetical protein
MFEILHCVYGMKILNRFCLMLCLGINCVNIMCSPLDFESNHLGNILYHLDYLHTLRTLMPLKSCLKTNLNARYCEVKNKDNLILMEQ